MTTKIEKNPMANQIVARLTDMDDAWGFACDAVDYPVMVKELKFDHEGDEVMAEGFTNTGRECKYYGVVVDRDRIGRLSTISTVTGMYDTLPPAATYIDLKRDLEEAGIESTPRMLYISGTGGVQMLTVDLEDMKAPNMKDDIKMSIQLITSVDGSKKHHCRLVAYNESTGAELVGIKSDNFTINARHTKTIRERHAAFSVAINSLVGEWNDTIMPFMALMQDSEFDKNTALSLLDKVMKKASIPKRHIEKCKEFYENDAIVTEGSSHSVYRVVDGLSQYIDKNLGDKPERAEKFREDILKRSHSLIQKAIEDFAK